MKKNSAVRGVLLALTVALAVGSVPAAGGAASAGGHAKPNKAILKAIL